VQASNYQNKISNLLKFSYRPLLDQSLNSLISLAGNLIILTKLPSDKFAASGIMISLAYSISSVIKNRYLPALNFTDKQILYGPTDLIYYIYKETRYYLLSCGIVAFIFLIFSIESVLYSALLVGLSFGLLSADIIRNICIIKNMQSLCSYAGGLSLLTIFIAANLNLKKNSEFILIFIFVLAQHTYIIFFFSVVRGKLDFHNVRVLKNFFKGNSRITNSFQAESVIGQIFNFLSILMIYLFNHNFYSAIIVAVLFSASIPFVISNGLLPKMQAQYKHTGKNFFKALIFLIILSLLTFLIATLSHYFRFTIIDLYNSHPLLAFEIIYGSAAFSSTYLVNQIFSLNMLDAFPRNYLIVRLALWFYLNAALFFGAVWLQGRYFNFVGFFCFATTALFVFGSTYSKGQRI
jgi:hypothetical protein